MRTPSTMALVPRTASRACSTEAMGRLPWGLRMWWATITAAPVSVARLASRPVAKLPAAGSEVTSAWMKDASGSKTTSLRSRKPHDLVSHHAELGRDLRAILAGHHQRDRSARIGQWHDDQPIRALRRKFSGSRRLQAAMDFALIVLGGEDDGGAELAHRAAESHGLGTDRDGTGFSRRYRQRQVEGHHALTGVAHGGQDRDHAHGERAFDQEALLGRSRRNSGWHASPRDRGWSSPGEWPDAPWSR